MKTVGLDVGGSFLKAAVVDAGEPLRTRRLPVDGEDPFGHLERVAGELVEEAGASALGVGVAGLVKWPAGHFVWGPHVTGTGVPLLLRLGERLGIPVVVDNDANAAAHGELFAGAARGARHGIVITLGTGIGAGLVIDGAVYRGRSFAGEVGHMVLDPDGDKCACGQQGCWETLVSGSVLDRRAVEMAREDPDGIVAGLAGGSIPTARNLVEAAEQGDRTARDVLTEAGHWLGVGITNLVAALDPEVIVIAGAAAAAGPHLLEPAHESMEARLSGGPVRDPVALRASPHLEMAGAVGAAMLATEIAVRS